MDKIEVLNRFLPAAIAAYAPFKGAVSMELPADYELCGVIGQDKWGIVLKQKRTETILVAFRGTETLDDWFHNFTAIPVPTPDFIGLPGHIHYGFLEVYNRIRYAACDLVLAAARDGFKIKVTGHSLGGALAKLFALDWCHSDPDLVTFAAPRLGSPAFATAASSILPQALRVVNFGDVVPQVPLSGFPVALFQHFGQQMTVRGGFNPFDVAYGHNLIQYRTGLKLLI